MSQRLCRGFVIVVWVLLCQWGCSGSVARSSNAPPTITQFDSATIRVQAVPLQVEVARTPKQRQTGLAGRQQLPVNQGMLFVYPDSEVRYFTMRDTLIPLSIAFLDADGTILGIQHMQPRNRTHYQSKQPARYALEVNAQWFGRHDIRVGDHVDLSEALK